MSELTCHDCSITWEAKRPRAGSDGKYRCKKCGVLRRVRKYQGTEKGQAKIKEYYDDNKEHIVQRVIQWGRDNKEREAAIKKKYRSSEKGKAANRRKCKKHYWTAPEYYRMRARKDGSELILIRDLFDRQPVCQLCGTDEKLTVDHMWPSSKGGKTTEDNIQTLCVSCNSFKRDKIFLAENQGILVGA